MTYVICPRCDVTTYSRALWATVETCPSCGAAVSRRFGQNVIPISSHPRFGRPTDPEPPPDHPTRGA